ncbi:hypothetical protein [Aggregatilinea lenta]|uniref:hypothetical protein n=1 Tax=Aggregatilinea lenta TaxID=913108 RepID=UPI000E5BD33B|nr:hypothetical protein [Aggregatilinea lenta]
MQRWRVMIVIGLVGLLAACGSSSEGDGLRATNTPAITPTPTAPPTASPIGLRLQAQYETLSAAQESILAVWESLANGETVQCGDYPAVPDPASISAAGETHYEAQAALLRRAAIDTGQAVSLWQAECSSARSAPAPETIREARLAASSAGDALSEAVQLDDPGTGPAP